MNKVFIVRIIIVAIAMFIYNALNLPQYTQILFYIAGFDIFTIALMQLSRTFFLPVICTKQKIDYKHIFKNNQK